MTSPSPNPQLLTVARESRGLTQTELAEQSGVSQGYLSKAENGMQTMAADKLRAVADTLGYSPDLFSCGDTVQGIDALFHRKLKTAPVGQLRQAQAQINIRRIQVRRLMQGVAVDAPLTFPRLDPEEVGGAAEVARMVRRAWKVPLGPILNLIELLEAAGGVVVSMKFATPKVSAAALWPREDERPMFFVHEDHGAERQRFSLAHELAHIVMHAIPAPELERQADEFAAEFLMPERECRPQLTGGRLNLARLIDIKHYWRVAMSMVAKRAHDLGALTERQARSLWQMLSARGFLKKEPFPIPHEQPSVLRAVIATHQTEHGYSTHDLSSLAFIQEIEFGVIFGGTPVGRRLRAV